MINFIKKLFSKKDGEGLVKPEFVSKSTFVYSDGKVTKKADLYEVAKQLYGDEEFCRKFSKFREIEGLKIDLVMSYEKTKKEPEMVHKVFAESRALSDYLVGRLRSILGLPTVEEGGVPFNYVLALLLLIVKQIAESQDSNFFLLTLPPKRG